MHLTFDGRNNGRIIATTAEGEKYEQTFEPCKNCRGIAMVLKPMTGDKPAEKRCRCSRETKTIQ